MKTIVIEKYHIDEPDILTASNSFVIWSKFQYCKDI